MESARHHICIYHVILIGLGQELHLHLPLQCNSEFLTSEKFTRLPLFVLSGTSVWRPQSRYTVSRIECRIKFPQNQRCRAKIALHPPKSGCRTFLRTPLSHFLLIRSRQGARRAGGGYRGTFGFRKRIALRGGVAATVTPVALHCATKCLCWDGTSILPRLNLSLSLFNLNSTSASSRISPNTALTLL